MTGRSVRSSRSNTTKRAPFDPTQNGGQVQVRRRIVLDKPAPTLPRSVVKEERAGYDDAELHHECGDTGAFAERVKFNALLIYSVLFTFLVYLSVAHMVWGKGGYWHAYLAGVVPVLDFAGGAVVHITTGVSALV